MDGLFKYIGNRAWFAHALSYWGHLETARFGAGAYQKNSMSCVITASAPINDHAKIRLCTLWVCKQQEYAMHSCWITVYSPLVNILLWRTLSVTPLRNLPVNKRLSKLFIYVHKNLFAPQTSDLMEKLALIFLYNFHRDHILLKLKIKKVIPENQCEKHKY